MNKAKTFTNLGILSLIAAGVFNIIVFLCFREYNSVFWTSYAFTMLAFVIQFLTVWAAWRDFTIEAAFFGIPVISLSLYYLGVQLFVGFVFMLARNIVTLRLALCVQIVILAAFLFMSIVAVMTRNAAVGISDHYKKQVFNLRATLVDVETLMDGCTDKDTKDALKVLADKIRYSDPMMTDAVEDVDMRIKEKLETLRSQIEEGNFEAGKTTCRALELLYGERNRKLAISK